MLVLKRIAKQLLYYTLPSSYILMFHHITETPRIKHSRCILSFEHFQELVLCYKAVTVPLYDVLRRKRSKVAITFDDGLADVYEVAYPFLKEHQIPFTVFVVTDFLGAPGYITIEQLEKLSRDPLVTIGSHGLSHKELPEMDTPQKKRELGKSKEILEKITHRDILVFAYSHGLVDKETMRLAKCYQYAMGTSSVPLNRFTETSHCMPRFNVEDVTYDRTKNMLDNLLMNK